MMRRINCLSIKSALMLGLMSAVSGCLRNELSGDCRSYISFRYTYNISGVNLFQKQVSQLHLLLFDDAGIYREQVVRSSDEDFFAADHSIALPAEMVDVKQIITLGGCWSETFVMTPAVLIPGRTRISDITLALKPLGRTTEKMPSVFHGGRIKDESIVPEEAKEGMSVELGYCNERHEVELMKISNVFRILLKVTKNDELVPGTNFDFEITAPNSVMDLMAEPVGNEPYSYAPYLKEEILGTDYYVGEIWTPRLKAGASKTLVIRENIAPYSIAFEQELDELLYSAMLQAQEEGVHDFQEFLDRRDRFEITLILKKIETGPGKSGYMSSQISVDDWIVREESVDS